MESITQCRYTCAVNYSWNGNFCVADTRTYTCAAKPATGTDWNTVSSYMQTWSGSEWLPSDSETTYNITPSSTECHFQCLTNYTWNGTICAADTRNYTCPAKPATGTDWNTVSSYTQTWNGTTWLPVDDTTAEYNTEASTTDCRYECASDYYWNGVYCVNNKVICTGQTQCYNDSIEITCPLAGGDFYGQDAQYAEQERCVPKNYTVSGSAPEEIVADNNTGLQWQRTLPTTYTGCAWDSGTKCTWQGALNYCDNLLYGNFDDWRLPVLRELETLSDYDPYNPAIDTAIFPDNPAEGFWSSSPYVIYSPPLYAWSIDFNSGAVGYANKETTSLYVRCVRGDAPPESSFTEATVAGNAVVIDTVTGLQWTTWFSSLVSWQNALAACENLNYAGYNDWRLPNFNELRTLLDITRCYPASTFPGMDSSYTFWSSSSHANDAACAWSVRFIGYEQCDYKSSTNFARCVR
jgi:hypothetical protein